MIPWILDVAVFPLLFGLGYWVWGTQEAITVSDQNLNSLKSDVARIYAEGTTALKSHLQEERYADAKFEGVQDDVEEIKGTQKEIQAAIQELVGM